MSRKKLRRAKKDYQDMAKRARRAIRVREHAQVVQEVREELEPYSMEVHDGFWDCWFDWDYD